MYRLYDEHPEIAVIQHALVKVFNNPFSFNYGFYCHETARVVKLFKSMRYYNPSVVDEDPNTISDELIVQLTSNIPKGYFLSKEDVQTAASRLNIPYERLQVVIDLLNKIQPVQTANLAYVKPNPLLFLDKYNELMGGISSPVKIAIDVMARSVYATPYSIFTSLVSYHTGIAKQTTQFGLFMLFGYRYREAGFDSVDDFIAYLNQGQANQLDAFVKILTYPSNRQALQGIQTKDAVVFASGIFTPNGQTTDEAVILGGAIRKKWWPSTGRVMTY